MRIRDSYRELNGKFEATEVQGAVQVLNGADQVMFEINITEDGSLRIRGLPSMYRGKFYNESFRVIPECANAIRVERQQYKSARKPKKARKS